MRFFIILGYDKQERLVKDMLNYEDFEEKHFNVEKFLKERLLMFLDDVALPTGGTAKRELVFIQAQ